MKRLLFFLIFFNIYISSFAQATGVIYNRGIVYSPGQYTDIEDSPYLYKNWVDGEVITDNNKHYQLPKINLDLVNNKFVYNQNDTTYEFAAAIKEIHLNRKGSEQQIFKNGFSNLPNRDKTYFVQVLVQGSISLVKDIQEKIEDEYEYGNADKKQAFKLVEYYYIISQQGTTPIKLSNKDLSEALKDKWNMIRQYIKSNKFSLKKETDVIKVIQYYNSI